MGSAGPGQLGHTMILLLPLLALISSSRTVSGRLLVKRSDIITGRGFAAPPKLTIDTHPSPDPGHFYTDNELQYNSYQQHPGTKHQPPYSYRQPQQESTYLPQSDYHKLQKKLSTNDQLRSYIKTLRQQFLGNIFTLPNLCQCRPSNRHLHGSLLSVPPNLGPPLAFFRIWVCNRRAFYDN